MALATSTMLALGAIAASTAATAYNTNKTAKRQDNQLADSIRSQSKLQKEQNQRVNDEVAKVGNSTMEDSRQKRMGDFLAQLGRNRQSITSGLTPTIGSDAFKADSATAATGALDNAGNIAGLLSRIDAPGMQRQAEGVGYGHLATDTDLLKRRSQGQQFIDDIRLKSIRRNGGLDFAANLLGAFGTAGIGAGGATGGLAGTANYTPISQGGRAVYNTLPVTGYRMA